MSKTDLVTIVQGKHEFENASIDVEQSADFTTIKIVIGTKNVEFFYRPNGEYDGAGMYITTDNID